MKRNRINQATSVCVVVLTLLVGSVAQATTNDSHIQRVTDSFLRYLVSLDTLGSDQKTDIKKTVQQLGLEESTDALTEGLIRIYPEYSKAVVASDDDDVEIAIELLAPLADSDDKFLAADASFYLARALMNHQRFEHAMPRLEDLLGELAEFTVHHGSAQYFMGVAQAGLLRNDEAVKSFKSFLRSNPHAPERLRVSAWRQIQQIHAIREGKLDDVYQRMDYSRRRLELIETDEATQKEQDKIVKMLTLLIKEEEKKECSSNCKKGGT